MEKFNRGEVWFVVFPFEEDNSKFTNRPVIVLDEDTEKLCVLSVKVTKHKVRSNDQFDTPILYWEKAGLRCSSTARVSKVMNLQADDFIFKIGDLHPDDLKEIEKQYIEFMNKNKATE